MLSCKRSTTSDHLNTLGSIQYSRAMEPRAILFDIYSVGLLAEQLFHGHGQALGALWRDKQIEYSRLVTEELGTPPTRTSSSLRDVLTCF